MPLELVGKTVNGNAGISGSAGPANGVWYLDSDSFEVYDDFISGTVSATNWDKVNTTDTTAFSTSASTNAGGTSPEALMETTDGSADAYMETKLLPANKHYYAKMYVRCNIVAGANTANDYIYVAINGTYNAATAIYRFYRANSNAASWEGFAALQVLVVNTATDLYDVYVGGKKVLADQATATPALRLRIKRSSSSGTTMRLYVDDVRYSK